MKNLLIALIFVSFSAFAAEPTGCGYNYSEPHGAYLTVLDHDYDIQNCRGQLLDDDGECVDLEGEIVECNLDV